MNAARLARRLDEAGDDRVRWAEAICEEITDPNSGLVTKDHLDRRFAEFEVRFAQFETRFAQLEAKMETRFAQFETRMENRFAQFETRFADLQSTLVQRVLFAQVTGFIAIAILILLRPGGN